ncbi:hypothetical protein D3C75_1277710 [compost metagenome]
MIEQDAGAGKHIKTFTIIDRDPVSVYLGYTIRASWVEGCRFTLRSFLDLAKHLTAGRLIKSAARLHNTDGLQHIGNIDCCDLSG